MLYISNIHNQLLMNIHWKHLSGYVVSHALVSCCWTLSGFVVGRDFWCSETFSDAFPFFYSCGIFECVKLSDISILFIYHMMWGFCWLQFPLTLSAIFSIWQLLYFSSCIYYIIATLLFHLAMFYASVIQKFNPFSFLHFMYHFKFIQFNVCVGGWKW